MSMQQNKLFLYAFYFKYMLFFNRIITLTDVTQLFLVTCDHIKRLITLTSDHIKRLSSFCYFTFSPFSPPENFVGIKSLSVRNVLLHSVQSQSVVHQKMFERNVREFILDFQSKFQRSDYQLGCHGQRQGWLQGGAHFLSLEFAFSTEQLHHNSNENANSCESMLMRPLGCNSNYKRLDSFSSNNKIRFASIN